MKTKRIFLKIVSFLLLTTFIFQQTSYAIPFSNDISTLAAGSFGDDMDTGAELNPNETIKELAQKLPRDYAGDPEGFLIALGSWLDRNTRLVRRYKIDKELGIVTIVLTKKEPQTGIEREETITIHIPPLGSKPSPATFLAGTLLINFEQLWERIRKEGTYVQSFSGVRYAEMGEAKEIAPEDRTIAFTYGYNYAQLVMGKKQDKKSYKIVVSRDPRPTGEAITREQLRGVLKAAREQGKTVEIIDLEVATTPLFESAVRTFNTDGGIMITASHNPLEQNGWKYATANKEPADALLQGGSLLGVRQMGEVIENTRTFIERACSGKEDLPSMMNEVTEDDVSSALNKRDKDEDFKKALAGYVRELREFAKKFTKVLDPKIVLVNDPNGSSAARVNTRVLGELGLKKIVDLDVELKTEMGKPRHKIEPTKEEEGEDPNDPEKNAFINMASALEGRKIKVGIAYDFDADRGNLGLLKPDGTFDVISPQAVSALNVAIALIKSRRYNRAKYPKGLAVVGHCATSGRTKEIAKMLGAEFFNVEVGEVNVVQRMAELEKEGYYVPIGVEGFNGGTAFRGSKCRDGLQTLLTAATILSDVSLCKNLLSTMGAPELKARAEAGELYLSEIVDTLPRYESRQDKVIDVALSPYEFKTAMEDRFKSFVRGTRGNYGVEGLGDRRYKEIFVEYSGETEMRQPRSIDKETGQGLDGKFVEGGWRIRLIDKRGNESLIWLRGSKTEKGAYNILADSKDSQEAEALENVLNALLFEGFYGTKKVCEKKVIEKMRTAYETGLIRRNRYAGFLARQRITNIHKKHMAQKITGRGGIIIPREHIPDDFLKRLLTGVQSGALPGEIEGENIFIGDIVIAPMKEAIKMAQRRTKDGEPNRVILITPEELKRYHNDLATPNCQAQRLVLQNSDFLHLEGGIALARAIRHGDEGIIKLFYGLLAEPASQDFVKFIEEGRRNGMWNVVLPAIERDLIEGIDDLYERAYSYLEEWA